MEKRPDQTRPVPDRPKNPRRGRRGLLRFRKVQRFGPALSPQAQEPQAQQAAAQEQRRRGHRDQTGGKSMPMFLCRSGPTD